MVLDAPPVLVDEPVVITAQQDQIVQIGGTTVGPMSDVMTMHPGLPATTREPATTVTMPKLTSQPARDQPGPPPHTKSPGMVIDGTFHDRITGQSAGGLIGDHRARLRLGHSGGLRALGEGFEVGVDRHLNRAGRGITTGGGQFHQTVGQPCRIRVEHSRLGIRRDRIGPLPDRRLHHVQVGTGKMSGQPPLHPVQRMLDEQSSPLRSI